MREQTGAGGELLGAGVGNYLAPPLGNCLALEALRLGNYLAPTPAGDRRGSGFGVP